MERHQGCLHRGKTEWRNSKKHAICKPRREVSEETKLSDTSILGLQSLEVSEHKFSLFKPPSLWYFVMAGLANKYSVQYLLSLHSVQFSRSVVSDSLRPHEPQHARPPCRSPTPGVHPNPCPLSWWCHPTISSSVVPSPPALNFSQHQGLFKRVSSLHQVAKVLEFQLQHQSFQWTPRTDLL